VGGRGGDVGGIKGALLLVLSPSSMDAMDTQYCSQNGQRYNFISHSTSFDDNGFSIPSSDPPSEESQTVTNSDDPSLFVDFLANNYGLDADSRGELHAFSDVSTLFSWALFTSFHNVLTLQ
jgi:hypothetical protein